MSSFQEKYGTYKSQKSANTNKLSKSEDMYFSSIPELASTSEIIGEEEDEEPLNLQDTIKKKAQQKKMKSH